MAGLEARIARWRITAVMFSAFVAADRRAEQYLQFPAGVAKEDGELGMAAAAVFQALEWAVEGLKALLISLGVPLG